jgi:DNA-binding Lrp family transcriptional regulator
LSDSGLGGSVNEPKREEIGVTEAYVLVQAEPRTLPIAARLGAVDGVTEVHDVSGPYDALAVAASDEGSGLDRIVDEIRALPGVLRALAAPIATAGQADLAHRAA